MTADPTAQCWPGLPTETEIYILPTGEIIIADLPAELAAPLAARISPPPPAPENHVTDQPDCTESTARQ